MEKQLNKNTRNSKRTSKTLEQLITKFSKNYVWLQIAVYFHVALRFFK